MDEATLDRFLAKVEKTEGGCWLWTGALNNGYGAFKLNGKMINAHRVSFLHYKGTIQAGLDICHAPNICHTRACVNPDHLRAATRSENIADKILDGTDTRGEKNSRAKLTEAQILEIRASDESQRVLAKKYGVSQHNISNIVCRKYWKHLT